MPSVPNRYYNSPYIATAAQNLSEALFGSPERELQSLQMQQIKSNMEAQTETRDAARATRERQERSRQGLSGVFERMSAPGYKAGESDYAELARYGIEGGGDLGDVLAGPLATSYFTTGLRGQQAQSLTDLKARHKAEQDAATNDLKWAIAQLQSDTTSYGTDTRALTADKDRTARLENLKLELASREKTAKWRDDLERYLSEHNLKSGGKRELTPSEQDKALDIVRDRAKKYGAKLTPEREDLIMRRWAQAFSQGGDSAIAMSDAWKYEMGQDPQTPGIFGWERLEPDPNAPALREQQPEQPPPQAQRQYPPARGGKGRAAASGAVKEGATRKSKSGATMVYRGGQWVYQ